MNIEPVIITDKAKEEVKKILLQKKIPIDYSLRIDVKGSGNGCGNFGFILGFDNKKETDLEYTNNDIRILVEKKKVLYLVGLKIDYHNGEETKGFYFEKVK